MFLPPDEAYDRPLIGYVRGDSFSIAVDAGSSAVHVKLFHEALAEEHMPMPVLTILTHSHWDHKLYLRGLLISKAGIQLTGINFHQAS